MTYDPTTTALLLVDPYNDFLSEGGKVWSRVKSIAEEVNLLEHLRALVKVARDQGYKIYFVPHHRSSGFANTDLDVQLRQFGIRHVILVGMIANTCIEVTGR